MLIRTFLSCPCFCWPYISWVPSVHIRTFIHGGHEKFPRILLNSWPYSHFFIQKICKTFLDYNCYLRIYWGWYHHLPIFPCLAWGSSQNHRRHNSHKWDTISQGDGVSTQTHLHWPKLWPAEHRKHEYSQ